MHPFKKLVVLIVPTYLAGALSGYFGTIKRKEDTDASALHRENARLKAELEQVEEQKSSLQEKLGRIATVDFAEYQRLQNEEAQFLKAREILGKVFLVLFHDLLSGVTREQLEFAEALAGSSGPAPAEKSGPAEGPAPTPTATPEVNPASPPAAAATAAGVTPAKTEAAAWTQAENDLMQMNASKAEALLASTVIKDITKEQGHTAAFKNGDTRLQAMQGFYSGNITFLDPKRKPWALEMNLNSDTQNGAHKGEFTVRLIDDEGHVVSNLGQNGNIQELLNPVSPSKALIVRVYRTQFLQLYIFENQGVIIGNYYDETKDGKVEPIGRFRLQRS